jgi:hypothetical protein
MDPMEASLIVHKPLEISRTNLLKPINAMEAITAMEAS